MSAQQTNLDTVANNLANSATTGFHQRQVQFEDMIYQNLITPGSAQTQQTLSAGLQVGLGTKSAASEVIMTQGDFNQTNGPLDLAIQGAGFFQISRPDGTIAYTRAGNFHPNSQGTLVTTNGDTVLPAITIPSNATNITISQYGVVSATLPGQTNAAQAALTEGIKIAETKLNKSDRIDWNDQIIAKVLLREAHTLIMGSPPPAEVLK